MSAQYLFTLRPMSNIDKMISPKIIFYDLSDILGYIIVLSIKEHRYNMHIAYFKELNILNK